MAQVLAWWVLFGGVVQLVVHFPALFRVGLLGGEDGPEGSAGGTALVLRSALPLAFGAAVYQVNVMVDGLMAEGLLPDGGPTALYYANRIQQFPMALVAMAAISAVFPSLTALGHLGQHAEVRRLHDRTQFGILFLGLPAAVGLYVLAEPIAVVLFQHGNYGQEGIQRIASALRPLAIALVPAGAVGLVGRTYYALGDFKTPVRMSVLTLVLNAALNYLFVAVVGLDTAGLTLSTMVSSWVNVALLWPGMKSRLGLPSAERGALARIAAISVAAGISGLVAYVAHASTLRLAAEALGPVQAAALSLATAGVASVLAYFLCAALFGIREWDELCQRLARRLRR
jgi:putative peptidoglycan lipid II flippase